MFIKHRELVVYVFFGGLTTLVNFVAYAASDMLGLSTVASITVAWVVSVTFAFVVNRKWVFLSRSKGVKNVLREALSFFALRAGTYFLDLGTVWLLVDYFGFDSTLQKYAAKLASNVLVVIVNYIISKFVVFRKKS